MKSWQTLSKDSAAKVLQGALHTWNWPAQSGVPAAERVFVTISRQPGAGGIPLAHRLAERLNELHPHARPWSAWDRELIEKVSAEEGIARQIVAEIENHPHTWLEELLESFSSSEAAIQNAEFRVYRHVAAAIRALAHAGHVVLVGQGARFVTAKMSGGVHVRLVAPLDFRIKTTAQSKEISPVEAREVVEQLDRNRTRFLQKYWPGRTLAPEGFTLTLNSGKLSVDDMVDCLIPIIADHGEHQKPQIKFPEEFARHRSH
jgi:cytidylate kinase